MSPSTRLDPITRAITTFILEEFLPGEDPAALTSATPLISGHIVDSLGLLKLVAFLEERYVFEIEAHEAGADNFETVARIADLVRAKLGR